MTELRYELPSEMVLNDFFGPPATGIDDNGNMYIIGWNTSRYLVAYKSTDHGANWSKVATSPQSIASSWNLGPGHYNGNRAIFSCTYLENWNSGNNYGLYHWAVIVFNTSGWSANPDAFENAIELQNITSYYMSTTCNAVMKPNGDSVIVYIGAYLTGGYYYARTYYAKIVNGTPTSGYAVDDGGTQAVHCFPWYTVVNSDGEVYCAWTNSGINWKILSNTFTLGSKQTSSTNPTEFDALRTAEYSEGGVKKFRYVYCDQDNHIYDIVWTPTTLTQTSILYPFTTYGNGDYGGWVIWHGALNKMFFSYGIYGSPQPTEYKTMGWTSGSGWEAPYNTGNHIYKENTEYPVTGQYGGPCFYHDRKMYYLSHWWSSTPPYAHHWYWYDFTWDTLIVNPKATLKLNTTAPTVLWVNLEAFAISDSSPGQWHDQDWGTVNMFEAINEHGEPVDSDFIRSQDPPNNSICKFKLTPISTPPDNNAFVIQFRLWRTSNPLEVAPPTCNLKIRLMQNNTQIYEWTETNISATPTTLERSLPPANAANITNWSDLYVEFEAYTS